MWKGVQEGAEHTALRSSSVEGEVRWLPMRTVCGLLVRSVCLVVLRLFSLMASLVRGGGVEGRAVVNKQHLHVAFSLLI